MEYMPQISFNNNNTMENILSIIPSALDNNYYRKEQSRQVVCHMMDGVV